MPVPPRADVPPVGHNLALEPLLCQRPLIIPVALIDPLGTGLRVDDRSRGIRRGGGNGEGGSFSKVGSFLGGHQVYILNQVESDAPHDAFGAHTDVANGLVTIVELLVPPHRGHEDRVPRFPSERILVQERMAVAAEHVDGGLAEVPVHDVRLMGLDLLNEHAYSLIVESHLTPNEVPSVSVSVPHGLNLFCLDVDLALLQAFESHRSEF